MEHGIEFFDASEHLDCPNYRLSQNEQDEMEAQFKEVLVEDFIRPSHSPYGAPVLLYQKRPEMAHMHRLWDP